MGMFDYIKCVCTACGGAVEGQSDGGECSLITYNVGQDRTDEALAAYVDARHLECKQCGLQHTLDIQYMVTPRGAGEANDN